MAISRASYDRHLFERQALQTPRTLRSRAGFHYVQFFWILTQQWNRAKPFQPTRGVEKLDILFLACGNQNRRKPNIIVTLNPAQVIVRVAVLTRGLLNPFAELRQDCEANAYLCVPCWDKSFGCQAMCNPRRYRDTVSGKAIQSWRRQCNGEERIQCKVVFYVLMSEIVSHLFQKMWAVGLRDCEIPCVIGHCSMTRLETGFCKIFYEEMMRLSGCQRRTVQRLLSNASIYFLCYYHLNHSRMAQQVSGERYDIYCVDLATSYTRLAELDDISVQHVLGKFDIIWLHTNKHCATIVADGEFHVSAIKDWLSRLTDQAFSNSRTSTQ